MKKYILFICITSLFFSSCNIKRKDKFSDDSKTDSLKIAQQKMVQQEAMKKTTTVQIIDSTFNFGTVTEGEKVEYNYKFKNTGTNPLVIFSAAASCGCTVPEKPEKPILPGEIGFLKVMFNSSGKHGHNHKEIDVISNANPSFPSLKLDGEVKDK